MHKNSIDLLRRGFFWVDKKFLHDDGWIFHAWNDRGFLIYFNHFKMFDIPVPGYWMDGKNYAVPTDLRAHIKNWVIFMSMNHTNELARLNLLALT
jgi:hypothetical protein